ncbi:MAG TPA: hypothetical protein PKE45_24265, partial [Caldilineaceae bacterium]|nr:hypothetical protein [Caldilineaceae bacterium]
MSQINCYLPIKLRLVGEPSETQLEQLGQLLVRTLQARLAFAERTIAARYNLAALDGESDVREAYDPARAADGGGRYAIPAYDRQGQPVSVTVQARGRPWIIRRAIEFHAYVGAFLDLMERGGYRGADLAVYMDLFQEQRWVSLWQVQVNQSLLRSDLMQALATRVVQLSGVRNQTPYYAISGDEAFRQQLIEIDQDQIVAREIPALQRQTGTVAAGGDIRFPAGSQVLFASMMLPVITLQERAELGAALQVTVRLRDLTFVVNPVGFDRFERRFGLPWESYLHEYGDQAAFLHLQPLTIRKPTHISALTALVEQSVGQGLPSGPETVVYSRLDVLNNATLGQRPPLVREIGNRFSDEATRSLDKAQTSGQLEPKWKLAYVYTGLAISPQSVETARYRPGAGRQADLLIPLIGDRLVTVSERWAFIDFIKHNYTSLFPIPFEVLLDELKRRENGRWFERLFRATEEAADYETRLLIIRLARQTHYANDPAVVGLVNYHNQVNRQRSTGNVYNVASQQVILNKFFGDKTVSVNDIFYDVYNTYVHEEKRYKPKPQFAATWEANLLREAIDLIGRIARGEDTQGLANGYSEIEFADAVLQAVFKRVNITEKNYD